MSLFPLPAFWPPTASPLWAAGVPAPASGGPTLCADNPHLHTRSGRVAELVGAGEVLRGERDALLKLIQVRSGPRRKYKPLAAAKQRAQPYPSALTQTRPLCAGPAARVRVAGGGQGRAGGRTARHEGAHEPGGAHFLFFGVAVASGTPGCLVADGLTTGKRDATVSARAGRSRRAARSHARLARAHTPARQGGPARNRLLVKGGSSFSALVRAMKQDLLDSSAGGAGGAAQSPSLFYEIDKVRGVSPSPPSTPRRS